ncbi:tRNA dimethylallyltransferase [Streptosporangium vulgare]|uniref:tRNA (adenosine(37)-N6)-dimethylallyltransferase n=1 Tax=Streptosporangium vulgare TaxID=46190 RepID=UPI0031E42080
MDIGTAKLSVAERRGVPHHLLDIWDVTKAASVAEYQSLARPIIDGLRAREIVCRSWWADPGCTCGPPWTTWSFPGTDPEVRARLEAELGPERPPARCTSGSRERDPKAAETILPGNGRRIVRALEVIEISGRPFSATMPSYDAVYDSVQLGVEVPREVLDARVRGPGRAHVAAGLVDEVRELAARGLAGGRTPAAPSGTPRC